MNIDVKWETQTPSKMGNRVFDFLVKKSKTAELVKSARHAAAISYRNQILVYGINRKKTHPIMARYQKNKYRIYLHAEVDALVRFINIYGVDLLPDCSLYVLRTNKTGNVASSKPCAGCMAMIETLNVGNVYWT